MKEMFQANAIFKNSLNKWLNRGRVEQQVTVFLDPLTTGEDD